MTVRRIAVALFACLCLAIARSAVADSAPATPPALKIATADLTKIFNDLQETKDTIAKFDGDVKQIEQDAADKRKQLQDMQTQLGMIKPDAPEYSEKSQEVLKASIEFDAWQKETQLDVQRQQKTRIRAIFDKIQKATEAIAQERKIDLVISDQRPEIPDDLTNIDINQLRALINSRTIVYSDGLSDISVDIENRLDKDYQSKN
jgi:Skp family chaperone for outer membrane proteins